MSESPPELSPDSDSIHYTRLQNQPDPQNLSDLTRLQNQPESMYDCDDSKYLQTSTKHRYERGIIHMYLLISPL